MNLNLSKVKRILKAPLRYEALRELFIEANRKIVKLQERLNKAENQLLQKGVDEHFLESKISQLEDENNQLRASAGQSTEIITYVVLYDNFDTSLVTYLGHNKERAERIYNQNRFHDLYVYQGELILSKKTHRTQGSALK